MTALEAIFREKLIPWAQDNFDRRLIIAEAKMDREKLPFGAELTYKKIAGRRVLVRTRSEGQQKIVKALWPEEGLHETYPPKLICVLKGRADYRAGDYIITCGEGHFILQPPFIPNTTGGQPHLEGENRKRGSCDLLQLILMRDHINCTVCSSFGEKHWQSGRCFITDPLAVGLFRLFMREAEERSAENKILLNHILPTSFLLMWREIRAGQLASSSTPNRHAKSTFSDEVLQEIHRYIRANLKESLTIERVAQAMYMSPSQFTRYLRQRAGKSFVEILTEHRIEEAKRLLRETEWSVAAIAVQIGFKSGPYFTTFFTKNVGIPPSQYRQNKD